MVCLAIRNFQLNMNLKFSCNVTQKKLSKLKKGLFHFDSNTSMIVIPTILSVEQQSHKCHCVRVVTVTIISLHTKLEFESR